jgi:hypothetical protein
MTHAQKTPCRKRPTPHDLLATCEALVAQHTTAEILACGYFRGHPVVEVQGKDGEHFADDLTPTVDQHGVSVERPCVQCGAVADPDGPDPCVGMLPDVVSACCGHGVEEPYVLLRFSLRGKEALNYFSKYGVGPKEEEDGRRRA